MAIISEYDEESEAQDVIKANVQDEEDGYEEEEEDYPPDPYYSSRPSDATSSERPYDEVLGYLLREHQQQPLDLLSTVIEFLFRETGIAEQEGVDMRVSEMLSAAKRRRVDDDDIEDVFGAPDKIAKLEEIFDELEPDNGEVNRVQCGAMSSVPTPYTDAFGARGFSAQSESSSKQEDAVEDKDTVIIIPAEKVPVTENLAANPKPRGCDEDSDSNSVRNQQGVQEKETVMITPAEKVPVTANLASGGAARGGCEHDFQSSPKQCDSVDDKDTVVITPPEKAPVTANLAVKPEPATEKRAEDKESGKCSCKCTDVKGLSQLYGRSLLEELLASKVPRLRHMDLKCEKDLLLHTEGAYYSVNLSALALPEAYCIDDHEDKPNHGNLLRYRHHFGNLTFLVLWHSEPNSGNGADLEKYWWTQTLSEVTVNIPLPEGTNSKSIACEVKPRHVTAGLKNQVPVLEGDLSKLVKADASFWSLEDGRVLAIHLTKQTALEWWKCVLNGEPEIDTEKIEPPQASLSDLHPETRQHVEKMMFNQQHVSSMGLTSDGDQKDNILRKFMSEGLELYS